MITEKCRRILPWGVAVTGAALLGTSAAELATLSSNNEPVPQEVKLSVAEFDKLQQDAIDLLQANDREGATLIFSSPEYLDAADHGKAEEESVKERNLALYSSQKKQLNGWVSGGVIGAFMFGGTLVFKADKAFKRKAIRESYFD